MEKDVRNQEEPLRKQFDQETKRLVGQGEASITNNTFRLSTVSPSVSVAEQSFDNNDLPTDPLMPDLEDSTDIFRGAYDDEDVGAEADLNNLEHHEWSVLISHKKNSQGSPKDQINVEDKINRGHDIFMLVEKDYPLTRGLLTLMLCNKLQVDQYSEMADELLRKIVILANRPRQSVQKGSTSGIRACLETLNKKNTISSQDLIFQEKMESQTEITQTVSALKLPMLKTGDYDLWSMRMEQYLTHTDYALWEVIVNGDAPAIVSASAGTEGPLPPKNVEQKLARKNELKAKCTLLLAIPDEHLLKFHGIKDAKTLWEAIKARFRGNKESKKMQKIIMKQQYENYTASRSEGLDKTYDRFQKLISQLEIHGEVISQEDVNLKLLRSLPSAWNDIVLIMRNKYDLDTLSMDDLYNNRKVYESEIKGQSSSSLNSQNVAFVSSENTSSTNEAVNTTHEVSTANSQGQASSSSYADDVMFSFFVSKSNSGHAYHESEEILKEDKKKSELQWQRDLETPENALVVQDGIGGYDWSFQAEEGPTDFALMAYLSSGSSNSSSSDFEKVEGYHAVPPPYTMNYLPSRPDLSFVGLDDYVYKTNMSETISSVPRNESTASKSSKDSLEQPKNVRPSAPIIEEWESDVFVV
ncbi:hypothetical protein Tco_0619297 [Tanacetum coccineum]